MSPEIATVIEWSKLGANVLYLATIVYLFRILRQTETQHKADLLSIIERYHQQVEKNVEAFEAMLREVRDDK
jgi:hypothetical protein